MSSRPLRLQDTDIRTIYDLLDLVRVRPGMWIGLLSITRMEVFIQGFLTGLSAADATLDAEDPPFQEFHDWVAARLNRRKNGHGWSSMLLEACGGDESAALERFWDELDAFRSRASVH